MSDYLKKSCLLAGLVMIVLSSCVTNKHATYLQEYEESEYSEEYVPPEDYLIKPNDNLYVRVTTLDPRYSVIFNAMSESNTLRSDESSINLLSYPVELDGSVDLPYIGSVQVAGLTLQEAKKDIEAVLAEYVNDASITLKLVNNYVTVLGEVRQPGMFPIYKERLNIYQAIAMAGDVADFSDRYELSIIRQTTQGEKSDVKTFNITDKNIIDSEYYYVLPNDVIYVKPLKGRYFAINTAPYTFALATITAAISLFVLIQNNIFLRQQ
jgi:polysaccharide export outer membrane protein